MNTCNNLPATINPSPAWDEDDKWCEGKPAHDNNCRPALHPWCAK